MPDVNKQASQTAAPAPGSVEALSDLIARLGSDSAAIAEILDSLAEAVTIRHRDGEIAYANKAALAHMGYSSRGELVSHGTKAIFDEYIVTDEQGLPLTPNDIPSVRLLAGDEAASLVMRTVRRSTGELAWVLLKATLLRDGQGESVAAVTIIEDITKEKAAELRERFLARASETLMSSLDYQETLRNVAWLAVPRSPTGVRLTWSTRAACASRLWSHTRIRRSCCWPSGSGATSRTRRIPSAASGR